MANTLIWLWTYFYTGALTLLISAVVLFLIVCVATVFDHTYPEPPRWMRIIGAVTAIIVVCVGLGWCMHP